MKEEGGGEGEEEGRVRRRGRRGREGRRERGGREREGEDKYEGKYVGELVRFFYLSQQESNLWICRVIN